MLVKQEAEEKKTKKDLVQMEPIQESLANKKSKKKNILFKNFNEDPPERIETLTELCFSNKKVVNKLIKQKSQNFLQEMEPIIRQMPNLLDFENKRFFFRQELRKLKKNQYYEQIHLYIRREDIFMDSYAQLAPRSANEMKGKLHIQFTGERG